MLAPIYTYKSIVITYPECVHLLHAVLEHRDGLGDGLGDALSAVGGLELGRECAHLDAEALQVERLLPVADHVLREHLRVVHVALVQRLSIMRNSVAYVDDLLALGLFLLLDLL